MPSALAPPAYESFLDRLTSSLRERMASHEHIRVRIAPSPTGPLHIGTARTALINYLFAKRHGGEFILRIEDTDLERSDPKFEQDIVQQLAWLGIHWDEGILPNGSEVGRYGPYRQTMRAAHYNHAAEQLLRDDRAYFCFCSKEKLQADREESRKKGEALRYIGTCRVLLQEDSRTRIMEGERALLRLRMPEDELAFADLIRGEIKFDMSLFGDIAITKTWIEDGALYYSPLYNFAVIVDDIGMRISHVLRGEDHIANTPKQIAIARALDLQSPLYGHVPLILGPDKAKLSKRHGATTVKAFRDLGYYPEALINFLALLGFNPGTDEHGDLFSLEELVDAFDLTRVNQSGAIWDHKKLQWFNQQYARRDLPLIREEAQRMPLREPAAAHVPAPLLARAQTTIEKKGWHMDDKRLSDLLLVLLERVNLEDLDQALELDVAFFFERPAPSTELLKWKDMANDELLKMLQGAHLLLDAITEDAWSREEIESILMAAAGEQTRADGKVDRGRLLWPLRVALTGKKKSPGPIEIAAILGREETLQRIKAAQALL